MYSFTAINFGGKVMFLHHVIWKAWSDPIPAGRVIQHTTMPLVHNFNMLDLMSVKFVSGIRHRLVMKDKERPNPQ